MREELARHGGQLTAVPQISQNLLTILRVLKEEERYEADKKRFRRYLEALEQAPLDEREELRRVFDYFDKKK